MKLIKLIFRKETQPPKTASTEKKDALLFVLPSECVHLLKNHFSRIGKQLESLGHQDDDKKDFYLDPKNQEDRDFFKKLKAELLELSDYMQLAHENEFMEGEGRYDFLHFNMDQPVLLRFIEWCDLNHDIVLKFLFENDYF